MPLCGTTLSDAQAEGFQASLSGVYGRQPEVDLSGAHIVIIGGGKMGEAILGGWIAAKTGPAAHLCAQNFCVANPGAERRRYLQETYGVTCVGDAREVEMADIVVLAVKPQVMMGVLKSIATLPAYRCTAVTDVCFAGSRAQSPLFISVAAGLSTKKLEDALMGVAGGVRAQDECAQVVDAQSATQTSRVRMVRTMPNTPLLAGCGVTAICGGAYVSDADVLLVRDLFSCLGSAHIVDEKDIDAIVALSGSGPAYVAAFIEALRNAGVSQGLESALAESLAIDTMRGTLTLMDVRAQDVQTTREAVCSPGGTTLAALHAMENAGFSASIDAGIKAACARSKELALC